MDRFVFSDRCISVLDYASTAFSLVTSASLVALALAGFSSLEGEADVLDRYYIAVLCVLGGIMGVILFFAE